ATSSRLDTLVFELGLADSRHKAQALILAGKVLVNDEMVDKCGTRVSISSNIRLRGEKSRYVGRGGDKLASVMQLLDIAIEGRIAIDVGSSTGGFTDYLLSHGAKSVYAVDSGYNQLAHSLRADPRVVVMERTNAKHLAIDSFPERPNLLVMDVSFIGVSKLLPSLLPILKMPADLVILVKPQFELERSQISKGGVVKEEKLQLEAVAKVLESADLLGLQHKATFPCGLTGFKKGNQEYFVHLYYDSSSSD
ncbi:UNVERIFIED_CONTAM: hypothetical protein GTU68_002521, partial [Idotea baltica]|nr:hypothetical protein [Idotea baltica]